MFFLSELLKYTNCCITYDLDLNPLLIEKKWIVAVLTTDKYLVPTYVSALVIVKTLHLRGQNLKPAVDTQTGCYTKQ